MVVATMRDLAKADHLNSAAQAAGVDLDLMELDVTEGRSRDDAVQRTLERHGAVDILINNAGVIQLGAAEELGEASLRDIFETNVFAAFSMIAAVLPHMRSRRSGRIVNLTSAAAMFAPEFMVGYAASKHAMDALTVGMDLELRGFNIRVTSVAPVAYGTAMASNSTPPSSNSAYGDRPYQAWCRWADVLAKRTDLTPVAEAVVEAATAPDPKPRYLVAPDPTAYAQLVDTRNAFDENRRST